ncbi:hypothetical protein [Streptomyces bauhiniae]|uniref:hypothetical protein n=1 Tax=Streptomyces bauhiniae TaxID=2340725 RepID=UPI00142ED32D|nr:hypothetical protein [Streptomyces bauhiniae]
MIRTRRILGAAAIVGVLLATVACGSDKAGQQPSDDSMQAFQECLGEHGVTMPDRGGQRPEGAPGGRPSGAPGGRPSGAPSGMPEGAPSGTPSGRPSGMPSMSAEQQEAMQACASLRPQQGGSGGDGSRNGG